MGRLCGPRLPAGPRRRLEGSAKVSERRTRETRGWFFLPINADVNGGRHPEERAPFPPVTGRPGVSSQVARGRGRMDVTLRRQPHKEVLNL